ncbi:MAG: hypothetical protein HY282_01770 [Nitrospirae bacterium]|nr:hypothetical protein [Candidatus Manganitrophaceae bacterium]
MKIRGPILHFILGALLLLVLVLFREFGTKSRAKKPVSSGPPAAEISRAASRDPFSPEKLVATGERVIFGGHPSKVDASQEFVGRGQCPACHVILEGQRPTRFPKLIGVMSRAADRIKEARYQMFAKKYAESGEPKSGIRPHARTAGEYLIESIYCPSCYVVEGFGLPETDDTVSVMPVINRPEVGLSDYEMVGIVAYLQETGSNGDLSKVTAREDWESYFGKKLTSSDVRETTAPSAPPPPDLSKVGLAEESPEEIIEKLACYVCHKIPGVRVAQVGRIGPVLMLKTTAPQRLQSPAYQQALKEGRVRATTPKEYVIESILNPGGFIVPGFEDAMPKHFKERLTYAALNRLADFLLTLDAEAAGENRFQTAPPPNSGKPLKARD